MNRSLLVLLLCAAPLLSAQAPGYRPEAAQPDIPLATPDPSFPLRVHLYSVRWGGLGNRNHGYGQGNLLDQPKLQGFDYAFECDLPFVPNTAPEETYQARWKRQSYQLEILTTEVEGKHAHTCNLHLALEAKPFTPINRAHFDHGVSSSLRVPWRDPEFAFELPTPDHPVQFHVIDGQRREDAAQDHGWGIANFFDPPSGIPLQGADFSFDCDHGFITSSQYDNYYQGRWNKPGKQLELLLQRPGSDKIDKCEVNLSLKPTPYPEPHRPQENPTP